MATTISGILNTSMSADHNNDSGGKFEWSTATNLTIFTLDVVQTNLDECYTMSKASQVWSTICEGILSVIVGICGLMGNGATIAVLSRPAFKETFHKLLVCLSLFDSLFIGETVKTVHIFHGCQRLLISKSRQNFEYGLKGCPYFKCSRMKF